MEKKGIIAIVIIAVIAIAVIGLVIGSAINQSENKGETYYYIDGNGGSHDGETKVEWKQSSLPDSDYFTKDYNHYISFNTKSDGTGTSYGRLSSDAPKGSTLYVFWEYNYVRITNTINTGVNIENVDFKCGSTVKHFTGSGNPHIDFGGDETKGVFENHIEVTVKNSSGGSISTDGNVITVTANDVRYQFEITKGASVEVINESGQDKGLKLTYADSRLSNSYIEMKTTITELSS